ncbi:MAG: hypothetical protein NZ749_10800 [bacterium]|nr:hypothetical protein [bacterium]
MMLTLIEALKFVAWLIVAVAATMFFIVLAHANASAEARRHASLVWKLLNLSVLPLGILLFSALLTADFQRVHYPPSAPRWVAILPAFQVTTVVSPGEYFVPLLLYLLSIGMLLHMTRRARLEGSQKNGQ